MREVLGGGSGGRYYADGEDTIHVVPDSRNLPIEFTESRFPLRVERLGLAVDSGGAGALPRRARLREGHPDAPRRALHVDRRPLDPVLLGRERRAGRPAVPVTVDPGGPDEHEVDALVDAEPLRAGTVVRIRTTGGGGWGDPLDRPVEEVMRDIAWRQGVGGRGAGGLRRRRHRLRRSRPPATEELRASLRAARTGDEPFFDRGPGYARLSGGAAFNEFDVL